MDLQVHHLSYDHVGDEDVYNDLITLCKYCHQSIEEQKKDFQNTKYKYSEEQYMLARRMELCFCEEVKDKDITQGGPLNMMNRDVEREEWSKWLRRNHIAERDLRTTTVNDYFRNIRIKIILEMSEGGAPVDAILARGISYNMIRKYYGNRELAETILERYRKEYE